MIGNPATSGDDTAPGSLRAGPGAARNRRVMAAAQLRDWLTAEIRTHKGCEKLEVLGISRLESSDPDGCNWSYSLVVDPGGAAAPVYALACAQAVGRARAIFNLAV